MPKGNDFIPGIVSGKLFPYCCAHVHPGLYFLQVPLRADAPQEVILVQPYKAYVRKFNEAVASLRKKEDFFHKTCIHIDSYIL